MNIGLRRTALAAAPLLAATSLAFVASPAANAAVPGNDDVANAQVIPAAGGTVTGSNVGATTEPGELSDQGEPGATVWYRWTPTEDGAASFSTAGSDFDTFVDVYESPDGRAEVSTLVSDSSNDDATNADDRTSLVTVDAQAGTTYYIQVDGFNDQRAPATGNIRLSVAQSTSKIVGTVTAPNGAAAGICVSTYDDGSGYEGDTTTDSAGHYAVDVLPGTYMMWAGSCDPAGNLTSAIVNDVVVGAEVTVTKNIRVVTGASLGGHVATPAGAQFASVDVQDANGDSNGGSVDLNGNYSFNGLPNGNYTLHFSYVDADFNVHDLYFNGTTDGAKATPIALTAGCAYHANADFVRTTTSALTGACTPACTSAKSAATSAANALAATRAKAASDSQLAKKLKKKRKSAHGKAKTKLAKKLKKLKKRGRADSAAVGAAASASNAATAASTSACA